MKVIVPLAGPDLVMEDGSFRPFFPYKNGELVPTILKSRAWYQNGEVVDSDFIFVIRKVEGIETLKEKFESHFPGCQFVTTESLTGGALLSASLGVSMVTNFQEALCIDLADIDYDCSLNVTKQFEKRKMSGYLLAFRSENKKYSYLKTEGNNVFECAEKRVISNIAFAGTYFFNNSQSFFEAVSESIANRDEYSFKGILFMCPSYNGLIKKGKSVEFDFIENVNEVIFLFHNAI